VRKVALDRRTFAAFSSARSRRRLGFPIEKLPAFSCLTIGGRYAWQPPQRRLLSAIAEQPRSSPSVVKKG
jgi:hypothetical protein